MWIWTFVSDHSSLSTCSRNHQEEIKQDAEHVTAIHVNITKGAIKHSNLSNKISNSVFYSSFPFLKLLIMDPPQNLEHVSKCIPFWNKNDNGENSLRFYQD